MPVRVYLGKAQKKGLENIILLYSAIIKIAKLKKLGSYKPQMRVFYGINEQK